VVRVLVSQLEFLVSMSMRVGVIIDKESKIANAELTTMKVSAMSDPGRKLHLRAKESWH
jgi:hypothetical protein